MLYHINCVYHPEPRAYATIFQEMPYSNICALRKVYIEQEGFDVVSLFLSLLSLSLSLFGLRFGIGYRVYCVSCKCKY